MTLQLIPVGSVGVNLNQIPPILEWNPAAFPVAKVILTGNVTIDPIGTLQSGATYNLIVQQDATGGRTITWSSQFHWSGGAPALTGLPNAVDILSFICDGTNLYGAIMVNFL